MTACLIAVTVTIIATCIGLGIFLAVQVRMETRHAMMSRKDYLRDITGFDRPHPLNYYHRKPRS